MSFTRSILFPSVLLILTVTFGLIHGNLTGRWGPHPDRVEAGERLGRLPATFGSWRLARETPLDPAVERLLQTDGYINAVYENVDSGDVITVAVLLGPPGPISVHTPEVCYSSRDYRITQARSRWRLDKAGDDEFWDLRLQANDVSGSPLRVIYGWTKKSSFEATESPRFKYGGSSHLYKLQLAGPVPEEGTSRDVCAEFLSAFLPVLRDYMLVE